MTVKIRMVNKLITTITTTEFLQKPLKAILEKFLQFLIF